MLQVSTSMYVSSYKNELGVILLRQSFHRKFLILDFIFKITSFLFADVSK
jgi:hypothetical protein